MHLLREINGIIILTILKRVTFFKSKLRAYLTGGLTDVVSFLSILYNA
ncbi:MAG TPA: hypothetical protein VF008_18755 [Niastella sp.]